MTHGGKKSGIVSPIRSKSGNILPSFNSFIDGPFLRSTKTKF